jgi:hypothetical protein
MLELHTKLAGNILTVTYDPATEAKIQDLTNIPKAIHPDQAIQDYMNKSHAAVAAPVKYDGKDTTGLEYIKDLRSGPLGKVMAAVGQAKPWSDRAAAHYEAFNKSPQEGYNKLLEELSIGTKDFEADRDLYIQHRFNAIADMAKHSPNVDPLLISKNIAASISNERKYTQLEYDSLLKGILKTEEDMLKEHPHRYNSQLRQITRAVQHGRDHHLQRLALHHANMIRRSRALTTNAQELTGRALNNTQDVVTAMNNIRLAPTVRSFAEHYAKLAPTTSTLNSINRTLGLD